MPSRRSAGTRGGIFQQRRRLRAFTRHAAPRPGHGEGLFAEVHVDAELGTLRVPRIVGVYSVGSLLNAKTARSQLIGGMVWGLGTALEEGSHPDVRHGRFTNANLAEYHVPVNADIGEFDVSFVDVSDMHFNPLGIRGIGEIGITGVPAAIANAVYHATGVRVRDLPITLDKVAMPMRA